MCFWLVLRFCCVLLVLFAFGGGIELFARSDVMFVSNLQTCQYVAHRFADVFVRVPVVSAHARTGDVVSSWAIKYKALWVVWTHGRMDSHGLTCGIVWEIDEHWDLLVNTTGYWSVLSLHLCFLEYCIQCLDMLMKSIVATRYFAWNLYTYTIHVFPCFLTPPCLPIIPTENPLR